MAPPGTPANRVKVLNEALRKTTSNPDVKNAQTKIGLIPMAQSPGEAKQYVANVEGAVARRIQLLKALPK